MIPIGELRTGARVRKENALRIDYAYNKTGTVCRTTDAGGREMVGVHWDGGQTIIAYPPETLMEEMRDAAAG